MDKRPEPFLKAVAKGYYARYRKYIADIKFVFPNKRSAAFFMRYLHEEIGDNTILAPELLTISDFIASISDYIVDSRIDLLFLLYKTYCRIVEENGGTPPSFDSFRGWGDVALADFSEVDMYGIDPSAIFSNIKDFKDIQSTYLSDEHREVLHDYLGADFRGEEKLKQFWKHYDYVGPHDDNEHDSVDIKNRFRMLWESLGELYVRFRDELMARGMSYSGMSYKNVAALIEQRGSELFKEGKIVFVGFNVLTGIELKIFKLLKKLPSRRKEWGSLADFVWDLPGEALKDSHNSAMRQMKANIARFPKAEWLDLDSCATKGEPEEIKIIASPSNTAQTHIVAEEIEMILREEGGENIDKARMAVILPDENLLFPLLYSIPTSVSEINLTMGYPLKLSSAISLLKLLRGMQLRKRRSGIDVLYFHEDVKLLIAHPFVQAVADDEEKKAMRNWLASPTRFTVACSDAVRLMPSADIFFTPFSDTMPEKPIDVLKKIFLRSREAIGHTDVDPKSSSLMLKVNIDVDNIDAVCEALTRIDDAMAHYDVALGWKEVFVQADRLLNGERVPFEGEPLRGMQVMGLLETRSLDFEYVIIPSMNERIIPRRMRKKTFIPASIRAGFGLPPAGFQESVFAYYFYRLIARAKRVALIYDARTGGIYSGGPSRYIEQLKYLYARDKVKIEKGRFTLNASQSEVARIDKYDFKEVFERYIAGKGDKNLSPSAIEDFRNCPMQFFFKYIANLSDEGEPMEFMDVSTLGSIVHKVFEELYMPDAAKRGVLLKTPVVYDEKMLLAMSADTAGIFGLIRKHINKEYLHCDDAEASLTGETQLLAEVWTKIVAEVLRHDASIAPLKIYGVEVREYFPFPISDGREINMTFSIDRVDMPGRGEQAGLLRVVDYKTGNADLKFKDTALEDIWEDEHSKNLFQILSYSIFLNKLIYGDFEAGENVENALAIYSMNNLNDIENIPTINNDVCFTDKSFKKRFLEMFRKEIDEIFDIEKVMEAEAGNDQCLFCSFKGLCR